MSIPTADHGDTVECTSGHPHEFTLDTEEVRDLANRTLQVVYTRPMIDGDGPDETDTDGTLIWHCRHPEAPGSDNPCHSIIAVEVAP